MPRTTYVITAMFSTQQDARAADDAFKADVVVGRSAVFSSRKGLQDAQKLAASLRNLYPSARIGKPQAD